MMLDNTSHWPKLLSEMRFTWWGCVGMSLLLTAACAATSADTVEREEEIKLPPRKSSDTDAENARGRSTTVSETTTEAGAPLEPSKEEPSFLDAFTRANNADLGNGWNKKSSKFSLVNNAVQQTGTGSYADLIVRRPASEAALDVEISADFTFGVADDSDPSLYARMTNSDAPDTLTGYTFFVTRRFMALDREEGNTGASIVEAGLDPELEEGATYHFTLRVKGTDPVELEGAITKSDGTPVKTVRGTDASANRLKTAGQIGFGSGRAVDGRWDNFKRIDLAP